MTKVHSRALDQHISVDRIIGHIKGSKPGPTTIFVGGIHGNEPAGVFGLQKVFNKLQEDGVEIAGNFYAIAGNLWALERGERFQRYDLNRLWTGKAMSVIDNGSFEILSSDYAEQREIHQILEGILAADKGPFYFFDIHTTSGETVPFLTVNDSMLNREFAMRFPAPIILGIEEYLDGPLLSYINSLGYIAFGFEAGQHDDLSSIENAEAFIYLAMKFSGQLNEKDFDYQHFYQVLSRTSVNSRDLYEIRHRYAIYPKDDFKMKPGYVNFQRVRKKEVLAFNHEAPVESPLSAQIFMPLYQPQGEDGFFVIRRIPPFFLKLSAGVRRWKWDKMLSFMPGVRWVNEQRDTLRIRKSVAVILPRQFLHLLGYWKIKESEKHIYVKSREVASRVEEYPRR